MFGIGEFSKLCQVTTKTLRHYDTIGLLRPAHINDETGYRYYNASQLTAMMLIIRLRDYGFPLDEVSQLMRMPEAQLAAAMRAKAEEHQEEMRSKKTLMERIWQDVDLLEKGENIIMSNVDVKIVERKDTDIISVREMIAIKDFDVLFENLGKKLQETGTRPMGAPIAIYHSREFDPESTDVELAYPAAGSAGTRVLKGGKCVSAIHTGSYTRLNETYTALAKWIDANGYSIAAPPYELYLNSPADTDEKGLVTEIYFPVTEA